MTKIAFILLCHKDPEAIIAQARQLTACGDVIAIHFDTRAPRRDFNRIKTALADSPSVVFARKRVRCGWGEWSLVQATLNTTRTALAAFPDATHFYMVSGDCMPIKSAHYAHEYLRTHDADFIESVDFFEGGWIRTGLKEERLIYRHFFNERSQKRLYYGALALQQRLGLKRQIPRDLQMMIGSQWWCLRRSTVEAVMNFARARRDVMQFFRSTWIPDETFFQTLVRHLVPEGQIRPRSLTFLMFSDYGMPVTFYNDHYDLLLSQDDLFARKISPRANDLKARMGALYSDDHAVFTVSNEGRSLHKYLTERGRVGRRFARRAWEAGATLGHQRTLMIIACKKWHVAKRLLECVRRETNIPALEYLFHEEATALPDLGGLQSTVEKRNRHRRVLMRMLFDHHQTDQMIICLDPGDFDLITDFYNDSAQVRLLEIGCNFTDEYLVGHAMRVGLAGPMTPPATIQRLLPTIRNDVSFESDRLRDADLPFHFRVDQNRPADQNAGPLAAFLDIPPDRAKDIAATEHLFVD